MGHSGFLWILWFPPTRTNTNAYFGTNENLYTMLYNLYRNRYKVSKVQSLTEWNVYLVDNTLWKTRNSERYNNMEKKEDYTRELNQIQENFIWHISIIKTIRFLDLVLLQTMMPVSSFILYPISSYTIVLYSSIIKYSKYVL